MLKLLPPQSLIIRSGLTVAILFIIVAESHGQIIINFSKENPS